MSEYAAGRPLSNQLSATGILVRSSPEVGFVCRDTEQLNDRLWVSGLEVIEPDEAAERGYKSTSLGALVATGIRRATMHETMQINAGEDTKYPIRLLQLYVELGGLAQAGMSLRHNGAPLPADPFAYRDILGGIGVRGVMLEMRRDFARLPHVSIDTRFPVFDRRHGVAGYLNVLDHMDAYPRIVAEQLRYMVINLGPGSREHRVYPALSRDIIGNTDPKRLAEDMVRYVRNHPNPDEIVGYAIEMKPPSYLSGVGCVVEACVGSPVGLYAHDGATMSADQFSYAIMASIDESSINGHKSLI